MSNDNANPSTKSTSIEKTPEETKAARTKWRRRFFAFGIALAVICKFVPDEYRAPCEELANLCKLGL
jgi:hypothetical protein